MISQLAVCLLTHDRHEMTARTLASFRAWAQQGGDILLHGDDCSLRHDNRILARMYGFETVAVDNGPLACLRAIWSEADARGATHILHLEQDWEFVRAMPRDFDAECVRLYGVRKERQDGPRALTGPHIIGTKQRIVWSWCRDGWQRGLASWGGPPSITRTELLLDAADKASPNMLNRVGEIASIARRLPRLDSLRPTENIVWHIG